MIKYKALMSDVDGTLVISSPHALPTPRVKQAILKAQKLIHIGVATGRPTYGMNYLSKHLSLSGPSIVSGGAQIIDTTSHKVLWKKPLLAEDIKQIHLLTNGFTLMHPYRGQDKIFSLKQKEHEILEMAIQGISLQEAERLVASLTILPTIGVHTVNSWIKGKIDVLITHAEATKQHGIFEVAKLLQIDPAEIVGIGDGGNDFPLLMACGLKIAMGNASDSLKAIADYIAPPVEEDGLAHIIERFILN